MGFWKNVRKEWENPNLLLTGALLLNVAIIVLNYKHIATLILSLLSLLYIGLTYIVINKKEK